MANDETEVHDYAIYCRALARCYFSRYGMTADALDLVEAAEYSATAYHLFADVTDTDHNLLLPSLAQSRSSISNQPLTSPPFASSGFTAAIEWAMSALRRANDKTNIETYASYCQALAHCHFSRYGIAKDPLDLEEAAEYSATVYRLADATGLSLLDFVIHRTTTMDILVAYLRSYRDEDRDASFLSFPSIDVLETLETLISSAFGPRDPYYWRVNLGGIFSDIYHNTRDPLQMQMAITQHKKAFEWQVPIFHPEEHPNCRWVRHFQLALLLLERYKLFGDSSNLDIAINNLHTVDAQMPSDPLVASLLSTVFMTRFLDQPPGPRFSLEDKERAISCWQSIEPEHRMGFPHFLGMALYQSYHQFGDQTDLTQAIQHLEESLLYDLDHGILLELSSAYILRSAEGDEEQKWKRKANDSFQTPFDQYTSAQRQGTLALKQGSPECLKAFGCMASLLLEIAGVGNRIDDVYRRLNGAPTFSGCAAAAAVRFATASLAVEWLEVGMSVTTRQINQLRLDVCDLPILYPDHFETLQWLSGELRRVSGESVSTTGGLSSLVGTNRQDLQFAYKECIEEIRRKPGMKNFLLPLSFSQLAEAARYGPVILLTCDHVTSTTYAFIILNPSVDEPITITSPEASRQDIATLKTISQLFRSLGVRNRSPEDESEKQLERAGRISTKGRDQGLEAWLNEIWVRIVKPVFKELEKNNFKSGRVWWCPTGWFTDFPLHAAAPLSCQYISSYTYGLEVLLNARARLGETSSEQSESSRSRLSIVGIGENPDHPHLALPSVAREVHNLSKVVGRNPGIALHKLENDEASVKAVLSAIKSSQFVHLACHGAQDVREPLNSHLVLADGGLELRRILEEDLSSAEFAFLSACQTAAGDSWLPNESVHLAGGFVAAGFKGVVGTLWRIADEDAPEVVKEVYEAMEVEGGLDITLAAEGLNRAVRKLRESGVPAHRWVPFIHVGV
ncbi:hypothetical protein NP233_g12997 [Leucocoprinus birnbaumii]|uniref:CHAT domain-containing protein n=1 Tax=Leucocoprinus birnbaumii TaxID=56174 RepID=A0AAD5VDN9_9AGAR|nr:hypothetical protein NP233_g12997 [Leucocoprinus birnbaumii]